MGLLILLGLIALTSLPLVVVDLRAKRRLRRSLGADVVDPAALLRGADDLSRRSAHRSLEAGGFGANGGDGAIGGAN